MAPSLGSVPPPALSAVEQAWHTLAQSLGTTATAALMRRAAKRASGRLPALADFSIEGAGYSFRFIPPAAWHSTDPQAEEEVRALLAELCALLTDLTGNVITNRLASAPEVRPFLPPGISQRNPRHASGV